MLQALLDPSDSLERQNEKLLRIAQSLMRRVEQDDERSGAAYAQFERAALLEGEVRQRTADLERALGLLNKSNAKLEEANRELASARADLASAIEAVEEGFALFNADDKLVLFNSRFAMHLGDLKEFLRPGLTFDDYVRHVSQSRSLDLPPETSREAWRTARLRRHAERHAIFNVPLRGNRWVQVSEHRPADGRTVILQTDVSDIMRMEREARDRMMDEQAIMVRATLDHLDQGVGIFDHEARLVGWNTALADLLSLPVSHLHFGAYFDTVMARIRTDRDPGQGITRADLAAWVANPGKRPPLSFEFRRRTGTTLRFFAKEMPDRGFVVSLTDLTAERAAAARLSEANEMLELRVIERTMELQDALAEAERANASKSRFVAAASHDLLQPLSAAKLYLASLAESEGPTAQGDIVRKSQNALDSVERIIEALLDMSKLDAGTVALDKVPVSLGDVLRRLRDEFAPHAALKGLRLRVVDSSAMVYSNPGFLTRILQNLMANAIRYTDHGTVLVGARRVGGGLRLEVRDTGCGIPEEHQEIVFQEFKRLDTAQSTTSGLGLGLAIVERACQRLGHPLGLRSQVGVGTTFFLGVDRAPDASTPPSEQRRVHAPTRLADCALIVLLIENDAEVRRAISLLLGKWNVSVLDVSSGDEALNLLEEIQIKPDAMLVDYQLDDGENGLDLLGRLHARFGDIPRRLISANRSTALRDDCKARAIELMSKPLDPRQLEQFLVTAIPDTL